MKSLVDVNVWLALLVRQHVHNAAAREWFEDLEEDQAGMCRLAQLGLIRLLGNHRVMGRDALSAVQAWELIAELLGDARVEFVAEPPDLDRVFPAILYYPVPTAKLVSDAYLAAFGLTASRRIVTFDRGFRQFRDLDLELLGG